MVATERRNEVTSRDVEGQRAKIVVENLRVDYVRDGAIRHRAFDGLNVAVPDQQFVAIVGPSGCGKTTLLNTVAGLIEPNAGEILVDGMPVSGPGRDRGVVFQQDAIFMWRTVRKNVEYPLECQGLRRSERAERAEGYLQLVGLENFRDFYPKELSGGMKKRVAIATVLASQPEILLMDEPFGSLDYQTKTTLQEEILRIWDEEHKTTLFVTHDIEEALYLGDRVLVLVDGRIEDDLVVPFSRPRYADLRMSPEMQGLKSQLWGYL